MECNMLKQSVTKSIPVLFSGGAVHLASWPRPPNDTQIRLAISSLCLEESGGQEIGG